MHTDITTQIENVQMVLAAAVDAAQEAESAAEEALGITDAADDAKAHKLLQRLSESLQGAQRALEELCR